MGTIPSEVGYVGLKSHNGIIKDDYYRDLNFPKASKTFKMMTYDATISSAITMLKAIAKGATWKLEVPKGASQEKADFIRTCMDDMDESWDYYINDFMSILVYGFSVNEKVFKVRNGYKNRASKSSRYNDGKIGWGKLPTRSQHTIKKWLWNDKQNELIGLEQRNEPHSKGGTGFSSIVIPRHKFMLFRHNPEFNSPEGNSPLKNCYVPWKYKTSIEEYEAVGISRDLAGMPVVSLPPEYMSPDATEEQKAIYEYFKTVVRNITANEQAGLIMPKFVDPVTKTDFFSFDLISGSGSAGKSYDTDAILKRYDHRILMSFLADVMILGGDSSGSYSLASSKETAILKMVKFIFSEILDVVNRDLLAHTFRLNGWDDEVLPKIVLDDVEQDSLDEIGKYIQRVVSVGAMEVDKDLSDLLRKHIELTPADKTRKLDDTLLTQSASKAGQASNEKPTKDNSANNKENAS